MAAALVLRKAFRKPRTAPKKMNSSSSSSRSSSCPFYLCVPFLLLVLAQPLSVSGVQPISTLPQLNIDQGSITLSGVSSGAAFATQFHVSHSKHISGIAMMAGPPYYCAQGNVEIALQACMSTPEEIIVADLVAETTYAEALATIDITTHMHDDKVWLYTGSRDTVVDPLAVQKTFNYYNNYVLAQNIRFYNKEIASEHAWITSNFGSACSFLGTPFINKCGLDAPGDFLSHFYDQLQPAEAASDDSLFSFQQKHYVAEGDPTAISMGELGYAYIPEQCSDVGIKCRLHVAFHGCLMSPEFIGLNFVTNSYLNEYAQANNIVILYPQAKNSTIPFNPKGCWDWWGYAGEDYACQLGLQVEAVARMVNTIAGTSLPLAKDVKPLDRITGTATHDEQACQEPTHRHKHHNHDHHNHDDNQKHTGTTKFKRNPLKTPTRVE